MLGFKGGSEPGVLNMTDLLQSTKRRMVRRESGGTTCGRRFKTKPSSHSRSEFYS